MQQRVQGALDGGLDIPHNEKRFVGYDGDAKEFDAETMKKYIFGGHVAEYMEGMEEEEPEKFRTHFKKYLDNEVAADADDIEEMYTKVCQTLPMFLELCFAFVHES
jgi:large subunit ribosomal protein L5e